MRIMLPLILALALFTWMYLRDFDTFLLPVPLIVDLYSYTAIFLAASSFILVLLRRADSNNLPENSRLRRNIRYLLGSFWIIDGLLQIQPQMPFGFSHFVLYNSLQTLPASISGPFLPLTTLWNSHGIIFDALAGSIQIFLGLSLFLVKSRRMVSRVAILSTLWALSIWTIGEGLGGLFQPGLSLISGFPGGALIYALMGAMLIFRRGDNFTRKSAYAILGAVLIVGGIIQVIPLEGFWGPLGLASIPGMMIANSQPIILSSILYWFGNLLSHYWILWNALFAISFTILGVLWFTSPRKAGIGTIAIMGLVWLFGQDLGIFGMYGTDLNSALPFLLLAIVTVKGSSGLGNEGADERTKKKEMPEVQIRTG